MKPAGCKGGKFGRAHDQTLKRRMTVDPKGFREGNGTISRRG
jgi:hypothetical protein